MALPKIVVPKAVLPKLSEFQKGPASGLAEIRNSLNATAVAVEGSLPKPGGQSIKVRPKLPASMTNLIKGVEEKLPWKPVTQGALQIPLSGGTPERGSLEGPTPPAPSSEIPTRGSL